MKSAWPYIVGTACLIALVAWSLQPQPLPCGGRCNVILIVVDTLSAKHIKAYGYDRDTMPRTTAFFERKGQIFDSVTSGAAWTFPSFAAMYFSDLPTNITFSDYEGHSDRPQLFSALRDGNIKIRGIHLVNDPRSGSFILDAVYGLMRPEEIVPPPVGKLPQSTGTEWRVAQGALGASASEAGRLSSSGTPFFSFTHLLTVHSPYSPRPPYDSFFASTTGEDVVTMSDLLEANTSPEVSSSTIALYELRYDQGIAETDALIGDFLDSLSTTTLSNTAIVITGDHGEAFYGHGHFFHGLSVFRSEARVPLFIYVPGLAAKHISQPVSLLDLAPTILSLEGIPAPSTFRGRDLLPLMLGTPSTSFSLPVVQIENGYPFFLERSAVKPGVRVPVTLKDAGALDSTLPIISLDDWAGRLGDYKLIVNASSSRTSFYDTKADPEESYPLSRQWLTEPQVLIYMRLLTSFSITHSVL